MTKEQLGISYGLIGVSRDYSDARDSQFPFAHRSIPDGGVILTDVEHPELSSPKFREDYVCAKCTAAKEHWMREHRTAPAEK